MVRPYCWRHHNALAVGHRETSEAELEASSLPAGFRSVGRCYTGLWWGKVTSGLTQLRTLQAMIPAMQDVLLGAIGNVVVMGQLRLAPQRGIHAHYYWLWGHRPRVGPTTLVLLDDMVVLDCLLSIYAYINRLVLLSPWSEKFCLQWAWSMQKLITGQIDINKWLLSAQS